MVELIIGNQQKDFGTCLCKALKITKVQFNKSRITIRFQMFYYVFYKI